MGEIILISIEMEMKLWFKKAIILFFYKILNIKIKKKRDVTITLRWSQELLVKLKIGNKLFKSKDNIHLNMLKSISVIKLVNLNANVKK